MTVSSYRKGLAVAALVLTLTPTTALADTFRFDAQHAQRTLTSFEARPTFAEVVDAAYETFPGAATNCPQGILVVDGSYVPPPASYAGSLGWALPGACKIGLRATRLRWRRFCQLVTHEVGHVAGFEHTYRSPGAVMIGGYPPACVRSLSATFRFVVAPSLPTTVYPRGEEGR